MKQRVSLKLVLFLGLAICTLCSAAVMGMPTDADAASWDAGDWKVSMGGNINAFYVMTQCDDGDLPVGTRGGTTLTGLTCGGATDKDGNYDDTGSVQNGLLPASLNFSSSTNQDGWDISANVNVYYGIVSNGADGDAGGADALKFSTVDARQVYLTFGKSNLGTIKMGRDFGLFAFDAIINDMSLLGVGAGFVAADPGHTTLGGLGYGYVYVDRLAQINYSTPNWGGFQGTIGIFQGFDGSGAKSADQPGYHAKVSYNWSALVSGTVSASYLNQDVITDGLANAATGKGVKDQDISGWDAFAKVSAFDFSLLGYIFDTEGMSSLAIGGLVFPGFGPNSVDAKNGVATALGVAEESDGYMVQGTYTIPGANLRLGINWSESEQHEITPLENEKLTLGVYYNLTPALTLLVEYSDQESTGNLPNTSVTKKGTDESQNYAVGAILFF